MRQVLGTHLVVLAALVLAWPGSASADSPELCAEDTIEPSDARYLRSLSLDLRGTVPTFEELEQLAAGTTQIETFVDEWLESEDFIERVLVLHRDLLWNNIENVTLTNYRISLGLSGESAYWRTQVATTYRGAQVGCLDQPLEYNVDGSIRTYPQVDGSNREGYVEVLPFWEEDPTEVMKVCGFDAQENSISPGGQRCNTLDGTNDTGCGCGPNLNWCRNGNNGHRPTQESLALDVELRIADIIRDDRSYLELFTGRTAWVNGPISHFWKYKSELHAGVRYTPLALPEEQLPDLPYTAVDTWIPIVLGPEHAGILTSPLFLARFQTNRARANRFYNAFLCQPFQPPGGGLPISEEEDAYTQDLQVRPGCKDCHSLLEPASAYWGRWAETGLGYLDAANYPAFSEDCLTCAETAASCSDACDRQYVTDPLTEESDPYLGWLNSYEFRESNHHQNVEMGPKRLVTSAVADGRLQSCVSETAVRWLLGRDIAVDEKDWVEGLAQDFVQEGYSYRKLIRAVLLSDVYRRLR